MDEVILSKEKLEESTIKELFSFLPEDAMVGKTVDGYMGGWMCCSYYTSEVESTEVKEEEHRHYKTPTGYGKSPEEAMINSILKLQGRCAGE